MALNRAYYNHPQLSRPSERHVHIKPQVISVHSRVVWKRRKLATTLTTARMTRYTMCCTT